MVPIALVHVLVVLVNVLPHVVIALQLVIQGVPAHVQTPVVGNVLDAEAVLTLVSIPVKGIAKPVATILVVLRALRIVMEHVVHNLHQV